MELSQVQGTHANKRDSVDETLDKERVTGDAGQAGSRAALRRLPPEQCKKEEVDKRGHARIYTVSVHAHSRYIEYAQVVILL